MRAHLSRTRTRWRPPLPFTLPLRPNAAMEITMELGRNREKIGEVHDKVRAAVRAVGKKRVPPLLLLNTGKQGHNLSRQFLHSHVIRTK